MNQHLRVDVSGSVAIVLAAALGLSGCDEAETAPTPLPPTATSDFAPVDLVADSQTLQAQRMDPELLNAWGVAVDAARNFWIASNHAGVMVVYDANGKPTQPAVTIPSADGVSLGAPAAVVINGSASFPMTAGGPPSKVLVAGEDGTISVWSSGTTATKMADRSANGAVYKGMTRALDGQEEFLYVANFKGMRIDVFDSGFNLVTTKQFVDASLPPLYGPFNVKELGGLLYVTYAMLKAPDYTDDDAGPGHGYVDLYETDGTLLRRLASEGPLNSPWGIDRAPANFGTFANALLVANFGDGKINAFDDDGNFLGPLDASVGAPDHIDGLWGLAFDSVQPGKLYFTAGPQQETHGVFGELVVM